MSNSPEANEPETSQTTIETNDEAGWGNADPNAPLYAMQDTLDTYLQAAGVEAVYGQPILHGETTIIPTAEIVSAFGVGVGYGSGGETSGANGSGAGGGGGGRIFSRPVAVIVASEGGVEIKPVFDVTKIALAALTAGGFMLGMLARMSRRH